MIPTFRIVTPTYNAESLIDRCIASVVTQAGDFRIRYHVQDAGSSDGTVARLEWWKKHLASDGFPGLCRGIEFTYTSEKDRNMYDGIVRGVRATDPGPEDFMSWINFDDMILPGALATLTVIAADHDPREVAWVGGRPSTYGYNGAALESADRIQPTDMIREGLCDDIFYVVVQQEGTFYRGWLWDAIDAENTMARLRLAGDWYLWKLMAEHARFWYVDLGLGRFSFREGQLSSDRAGYLADIEKTIPFIKRMDKFVTLLERNELIRYRLSWDYVDSFVAVEDHVPREQVLAASSFTGVSSRMARVLNMAPGEHVRPDPEPEPAPESEQASPTPEPEQASPTPAAETKVMNGSGVHLNGAGPLGEFDPILEKYRMLAPRGVRHLAELGDPGTLDWKTELLRSPTSVSRWNAIRRFRRRSREA